MNTTSNLKRTVTVLLGLAVAGLVAQAQTAGATAKQLSPIEQWIQDAKNPAPWMTWGGDLRIRDEYYNDLVTLADGVPLHEQNVIRFRGRLWTSVVPVQDVSLNARLSAEPRDWTRPAFVGAYRAQQGMEWRYGIFDNLYLKWTNICNQPLTLSAGRQDITFGDFWNWWLVADGTPGDGSWAFFLDSVRLTYLANDIKTRFDAIYIYQNARPGEWIPTLGRSKDYGLTEQNEQGVIFYASNKSLKDVTLDGYFMYKRDAKEFANGDNADIYTLGARVTGLAAENWQYSVEGAYQFGKKQDATVRPLSADWRDIRAFGVNTKLSYLCKDKWNNKVSLVYEYLSGDDPNTGGRDEMFDLLWGRWPRFSEAYIYSYVPENSGKIAQVNNIQRLGVEWTLNPIKNMTFQAAYNAWFAPEEVPTRAGASLARFSQTGDFRGHYIQTILKHTFSKHFNAHLWGEFIWEGDYYANRDLLTFLRAEVFFTF